jgi:hypothetical protein
MNFGICNNYKDNKIDQANNFFYIQHLKILRIHNSTQMLGGMMHIVK